MTLVVSEVRTVLARHLPGYDVRSVTRLGAGLGNVAYDVNGELVVRAAQDAGDAEREAALLEFVARVSPLPVPEPVFADGGFLAYRRLPGAPLNRHPVARPAALAVPLAQLLGALHTVPVADVTGLVDVDDEPPASWLDEAASSYREVAAAVPDTMKPRIEAFLEAPAPRPLVEPAFCHNDLGTEHVLVDTGVNAVTGVIDWSDAAIADPAHDLGRLLRDLGPDVFAAIADSYAGRYGGRFDDEVRRRAVFYARCTVLEDIAYGLGDGPEHYARLGLEHLGWTFG
ncbi:phosphotransferase family protein [Jiangella asiatica]|nr:phosphotransferase [Jiangella asiatica]